jgi:cobalamin synthase
MELKTGRSINVAGAFAKMSVSGWRWVFYFNAICFAVSGAAICLLYNPPPTRLGRENSTISQIKSVDYIGIAFLLLAVVGIITSLTWGGNAYPWNSSRVIAFLVIGVLFLGFLAIYGRNYPLCFFST